MMSSVVCAKASSVIQMWFFCVSLEDLGVPGFEITGSFRPKRWSPYASLLKHGVEKSVSFNRCCAVAFPSPGEIHHLGTCLSHKRMTLVTSDQW